jgi:hypothetical protein
MEARFPWCLGLFTLTPVNPATPTFCSCQVGRTLVTGLIDSTPIYAATRHRITISSHSRNMSGPASESTFCHSHGRQEEVRDRGGPRDRGPGQLKEENPLDLSDDFRVFCEACRRGDLKVCQEMISTGVNINARDKFDYTPLILVRHPSALSGHFVT